MAVSSRRNEFGAETDIVLVTFTKQENLVGYRQTNGIAYPILTDTTRETYQAYGLERGRALRVYGLRAARSYWKLMRESGFRRLESNNEDTLQLGGDFVVNPAGNLAWGFWGAGPDDRPSVEDLLKAAADSAPKSGLQY